MDSVEVLESGNNGRFGGMCPDGYVYDITVDGNHNFFAEGILVHNCFKNSAQTFNFKGAKFLSLPNMAKRGIDAQCKAWYVRGISPRGDGVLLLTATPLTNSPIEIFSLLSLAKGHNKVNDMMLSIRGADDFMNMMTDIVSEDDVSIDGIDRVVNVFTGLNNVDILRRAIGQSSTIKTAEDVGEQVVLPDQEDSPITVDLTDATIDRLQLYKGAFRWAIDDISGKSISENRGDRNAYDAVQSYFDEPQKLIGHPFNLINKMTLLIADPELDRRATFFTFDSANLAKAQAVVDAFNKKKFSEERATPSPFTEDNAVIGKKKKVDKVTGEESIVLKILVRAAIQEDNKTIIIDTMDSQTQQRWDDMTEKAGLDLDVTIPPKLAALLDNIQQEQAHPRGVNDEGGASSIVKQIIFCDILALHSKIRRLLISKGGYSSGQIAIITGKTNNTADEIMEVQDGFNAHGEDNKYRIIIANEKAEVGINLQRGTQAIHHLSIGWTPDSLTQRNGRGVRQGNKTDKVTVYTYDADGTFDSIKRDMVNKKSTWIDSVMAANGENTVAITGGMSKEQMESLIDVTGDAEAMKRIQESIESKEAASRAKENMFKQKVNLDTIKKNLKFISDNDPSAYFIIPRLGRIWALKQQVIKVEARLRVKDISESAKAKNENLLIELNKNADKLSGEIESSAIIMLRGDNYTPAMVLNHFNTGYIKKGENNADGFEEHTKRYYTITVIEGSPLHTEWQAELGMSQSLIDQALQNFTEQAKLPGSLPAEVGQAFVNGNGFEINGETAVAGAFIRSPVRGLGIIFVRNTYCYAYFSGSANTMTIDVEDGSDLTLPGAPGYDALLMEVAKIEDDQNINTFSDINPDVIRYRIKLREKKYSIYQYYLPSPYFPHVIDDAKAQTSPMMAAIAKQQKEVVLSIDGSEFTALYETEITTGNGQNFEFALVDYAKANKIMLVWNQPVANMSEITYRNALKWSTQTAFNPDDPAELERELSASTDLDKTFYDFVTSRIKFVDFTGAEAWDLKQYVSFDIWYPWSNLVEKRKREAEASEIANRPVVEVEEKQNSDDPMETVAITGNTKPWYKEIKEIATKYGGGKYKWDGGNKCWNVRRITWLKLIENNPNAIKDLSIIPATMRL